LVFDAELVVAAGDCCARLEFQPPAEVVLLVPRPRVVPDVYVCPCGVDLAGGAR
jgi:hypothetical protein